VLRPVTFRKSFLELVSRVGLCAEGVVGGDFTLLIPDPGSHQDGEKSRSEVGYPRSGAAQTRWPKSCIPGVSCWASADTNPEATLGCLRMENPVATTKRTWFAKDRPDRTAVAQLADDLNVVLGTKDTMTINGHDGTILTIDMEDAFDLAAALAEAVQILIDRGMILESRACR